MVTEYHTPGNLSKLAERLHVKFVGGRLCLDFVNTVGERAPGGAAIRDKIASYGDLLGWGLLAGILDGRAARSHPQDAAAVLERAIQLREALYRTLKRLLDGRRPAAADAGRLRTEIAIARANQQLAMHAGRFVWTFPESTETPDRILWPVSLSAAELLTSGDLANLRQCGGSECGWMFLDTSRNRRRKWCDMQDCGNRAKVRRFRAKPHR